MYWLLFGTLDALTVVSGQLGLEATMLVVSQQTVIIGGKSLGCQARRLIRHEISKINRQGHQVNFVNGDGNVVRRLPVLSNEC